MNITLINNTPVGKFGKHVTILKQNDSCIQQWIKGQVSWVTDKHKLGKPISKIKCIVSCQKVNQ